MNDQLAVMAADRELLIALAGFLFGAWFGACTSLLFLGRYLVRIHRNTDRDWLRELVDHAKQGQEIKPGEWLPDPPAPPPADGPCLTRRKGDTRR